MLRNNKQQTSYWRLASFFTVLLSGIISILGTSDSDDDDGGGRVFIEEEPFSIEITADSYTHLHLQGVNGEIAIVGEPGTNSLMISGVKSVQSKISAEDAREHLSELEVVSQNTANEVLVETIQPQDSSDRNYRVDYTITLPAYFSIQVGSVNGAVSVDSIENDVAVNMVNADVTLTDIYGSAEVTLANGSIDSKVFLPLQGTIDLRTATGDIQLDIPVNTSATLSAAVLFGNINVYNIVLQDEVRTDTSLSGTFGGGEGTISLQAFGDIGVSGF
ncbi:DUF4097 family beta strand repeat-containing protein [Kaarinaea lacus]